MIEKFKEEIGEDFYGKCQQRIIWAISVHSIECWLLPLYYQDNKRAHFKNCLGMLNKQLDKKRGFTIDAKKPQYYRQISEKYRKHRDLMDCYQHNPSLKSFVVDIESNKIVIPLENEW